MTIISVCPQYFANYTVQSTKGNNVYFVQFNGIDGPRFCTCMAYRYSGDWGHQTCKHIQLIEEQGCFHIPMVRDRNGNMWDDNFFTANGITIISTAPSYQEDLLCPGCKEPGHYICI